MRQVLRYPLGVASCVMLLIVPSAFGGDPGEFFDHLICRDAKEAVPHTSHTADVLSAAYAGSGCVVKGPAKMYCEQANVSNVTPPPTNDFYGRGQPGRLACYHVKCPNQVDPVTVADPFGTHTFTVRGAQFVCVPELTTGFTSCEGLLSNCGGCQYGCAIHHDPAPQPLVCVNSAACLPASSCNNDAECPAGYACITNPFGSGETGCCPDCGPHYP